MFWKYTRGLKIKGKSIWQKAFWGLPRPRTFEKQFKISFFLFLFLFSLVAKPKMLPGGRRKSWASGLSNCSSAEWVMGPRQGTGLRKQHWGESCQMPSLASAEWLLLRPAASRAAGGLCPQPVRLTSVTSVTAWPGSLLHFFVGWCLL